MILGRGGRIPHASGPETKRYKTINTLTNSIKTKKMSHIKKKTKNLSEMP